MDWDCIVVGGGAAGLSAALTLGRARRRTLLVDAGGQSNRASDRVSGLLGHDGRPPAELYALGRAELGRYPSVTVVDGEVAAARPGFAVTLADGEAHAAPALILAAGMDYRPLDVPGVAERWGHTAFHCPFCHGFEHQDERLAVLSDNPHAVEQALLLRHWSDDVVLLSPRPLELDAAARASLGRAGVRIEARPVVALRDEGAELADGTILARDAFLVAFTPVRRTALADALGADLAETGGPVVDALGRTSVPGLFACGDVSTPMPQITAAVAEGVRAAAAVVQAAAGARGA
jgi:thioredoxin reductase